MEIGINHPLYNESGMPNLSLS